MIVKALAEGKTINNTVTKGTRGHSCKSRSKGIVEGTIQGQKAGRGNIPPFTQRSSSIYNSMFKRKTQTTSENGLRAKGGIFLSRDVFLT